MKEFDHTIQATGLGMRKDRKRPELGFVTGTTGSC